MFITIYILTEQKRNRQKHIFNEGNVFMRASASFLMIFS
jgi:hypothetical protein